MLNYDDKIWSEIKGGYRTLYNPSKVLRELEKQGSSEEIWDELYTELHHQGDVDVASYASIPVLVRIQKKRKDLGWKFYALIATVEIERHRKNNPQVPNWLKEDYANAWKEVLSVCLKEINLATDPLLIRSVLGVLALAKGNLKLGLLISHFDESELIELLEEQIGWSDLYPNQ